MKHIPDQALNQHIAIVGKTGSGKTVTAKVIVEHLLDRKRQVAILDPTGAWYGMRLMADGRTRGYDVVLIGGNHADLPLVERSGAAIARLVTEQGANVVIDTSGFTVGEWTRWFIDFAGTLYTTIRSPLHLVIDEAHHFMPQQGAKFSPDAARMLHAGNRIMSGGRSKGIRGMLITQRPAKLHKDSLTCADTLIAMRVVGPQDRKAIKEWVDGMGDPEQGKAVIDSLASLKKGEGWVWYPEGDCLKRVQFPMMKTYDSSRTPEHGAKAGPKIGEIDLAEVKKALAEAVKEAEANDPKLLRKQIAELQKQLRDKQAAHVSQAARVVDEKSIDRAVARAIQERDRHWQAVIDGFRRARKVIDRRCDRAHMLAEEIMGLAEAARWPESIEASNGQVQSAPAPVVLTKPKRSHVSVDTDHHVNSRPARDPIAAGAFPAGAIPGDGELSPRQQRFLDTAATLEALQAEVSKETIAAWNGIHPRTGSFGEDLKALANAGCIMLDRGKIAVTEAGRARAGYIDPAEAIERAKSGLTPRQQKFFGMIVGAYPAALTKEAMAAMCDPPIHPRTGSFGEDLKSLVDRGLVDRDRGSFKARDFLFAATPEHAQG